MMSERKGVEIDYCPRCRGIWLERGELDKLLVVADRDDDRMERDDDRRDRGDRDDRWDRDDDRRDRGDRWDRDDRPFGGGGYGDPRRKRKKSFLSEMFEFGD